MIIPFEVPQSSFIRRLEYDTTLEELKVHMTDEDDGPDAQAFKTYTYIAVPFDVFVEFCDAESIGSFYATKIKGHYETWKPTNSEDTGLISYIFEVVKTVRYKRNIRISHKNIHHAFDLAKDSAMSDDTEEHWERLGNVSAEVISGREARRGE